MRSTVRRNALWLGVASTLGAAAVAAQEVAQDAMPMPEPIRIEVTGSRLSQVDGQTALPVQIIRRDEIERGNWTTAAELLSYVSANYGGTFAGSNYDPTTTGLSSANLRGLGESRTLVLLNGRRLSNYAFAGATVDLAKIPLAAVDRGHFFGRDAKECDGTMSKNPSFILESGSFFHLFPPNLGNCGAGQVPAYRVFSNRADANHRYTTDRATRDLMVTKGGLPKAQRRTAYLNVQRKGSF